MRGKVYAYAATVDDVAAYYELTPGVVNLLRSRTQNDAAGRAAFVGVPFFDQRGQVEIPTEFENRKEFENVNSA